MKKIFTLFAVAVLAFALQAETLTVAEGTETNQRYPFFGLYYDTQGTMSQVIYPEVELVDMVGKQITEIKFFPRNPITLNGGQMEYSLKIVEQNEFISSVPVELGTEDVCGHGAPVNGSTEFVITLDEPFKYDGGNLLLQCLVTEEGNDQTLYFSGVSTGLYGALYRYQGMSGTWYTYTDAFLPMTEFTYEDQDTPPEPPTPTVQTVEPTVTAEDGLYGSIFVYMIETEPSDIYYRISKDDGDWSDWTLFVAGELVFVEDGKYLIEAFAIAPGKTESNHVTITFTIGNPTALNEIGGEKTVADVRYFNAAGQEMAQPDGLTIVVTTFTDGTRTATKVMK